MQSLQLVGFPRSANTYLSQWCQFSNLNLLESHHHWDYELQARLLAKGAVTYILIRKPADAIASCMVWNCHHGHCLEQELQHASHHFALWQEFHQHVYRVLIPGGARVISFESIVDHSVSAVFAADGLDLCTGWSPKRYERRQRNHLKSHHADPEANLGSAFTGQPKPQVRTPLWINTIYGRLKRKADRQLRQSCRAVNEAQLQFAV